MNPTELKKHLEIIQTLIENGNYQHLTTELSIDNHQFRYHVSYDDRSACYEVKVSFCDGGTGFIETVLELELVP
ncbi:hypothetical protein [Succinimonas amylolytica]|uniref:hypothetical protein n=1 Tax=Succinimonas amylolytica TaxID=83769 RepID=UPI00036AEF9A|nr:hypothetical protein [Succinimonas amylolytica]